jgi:hypothetical protein
VIGLESSLLQLLERKQARLGAGKTLVFALVFQGGASGGFHF